MGYTHNHQTHRYSKASFVTLESTPAAEGAPIVVSARPAGPRLPRRQELRDWSIPKPSLSPQLLHFFMHALEIGLRGESTLVLLTAASNCVLGFLVHHMLTEKQTTCTYMLAQDTGAVPATVFKYLVATQESASRPWREECVWTAPGTACQRHLIA
jgi:hypothetical protein